MHVSMAAVDLALRVMHDAGIRVGLNASGGVPHAGLGRSLFVAERSGGRLRPLCNVDLEQAADPSQADAARALVRDCKALGGLGIKIPKSLGLMVQDAAGHRLPVDAPSLDVLFDEAGLQGLPVLIHSGDPRAFFRPPTPDNERYAELQAHPGWSFYGKSPWGEPYPSWEQILDEFERRVARHPRTTFVGAHFGNAAEEPDRVARMLDRHPNLVIDTAARVPEFGRHAASRMHDFFVRYQDRILFGSDLGVMPGGLILGSSGRELDPVTDAPRFFRAHFLYFETRRRGLAHPTPIQGDWTVDGIGLPRPVLEKLYWRNAARVFSIALSTEQMRGNGN